MEIPPKILILGGYGNTGFLIAKLLVKHTDSEIVLGGRNHTKAVSAAAKINQLFNISRVTAIPVVACLMQYSNQNSRKSGLWFQANFVEPVQFFHDINRLGVEINQNWSKP